MAVSPQTASIVTQPSWIESPLPSPYTDPVAASGPLRTPGALPVWRALSSSCLQAPSQGGSCSGSENVGIFGRLSSASPPASSLPSRPPLYTTVLTDCSRVAPSPPLSGLCTSAPSARPGTFSPGLPTTGLLGSCSHRDAPLEAVTSSSHVFPGQAGVCSEPEARPLLDPSL